LITSFLKKKGIDRQYHTYFKWDERNPNPFFSLFGEEFKQDVKKIIKSDSELDDSINAFLELGDLRNNLVHQNFASFPVDKTAEEIYALYKKALKFIEFISSKLS